MARKLDRVIVIDVESTCWEGEPPEGETSEIIEIGVCPLEVATGQPLESTSILVRPERSRISPFCTQLTTLTQDQVDSGINYQDACALLKREYLTKDRLWASYGDYDRRQFERQSHMFGVGYPFGPSHLNVKSLFAIARALSHEVGMDEALSSLDLPLLGTHHRAVDDAANIAGILSWLLENVRISPHNSR